MLRDWRLTTTILACLLVAVRAGAQAPKPSQLGSVTQQIGETRITIEYSRPVARGRALFGQLVPWGKIWTPGANNATTITLSTDTLLNGQALPAGTYSVWANPQPVDWTMIFSRDHPVWHLNYSAKADVLRVTAKPRESTHMETLAWYFPVVDGKRAELAVHWGTVVVPLQVEVP